MTFIFKIFIKNTASSLLDFCMQKIQRKIKIIFPFYPEIINLNNLMHNFIFFKYKHTLYKIWTMLYFKYTLLSSLIIIQLALVMPLNIILKL